MIKEIWTFFHYLVFKQGTFPAKGKDYLKVTYSFTSNQPGSDSRNPWYPERPHAYVLLYVAHLQNNEACNDVKGLMHSLLVRPLSKLIVICVV